SAGTSSSTRRTPATWSRSARSRAGTPTPTSAPAVLPASPAQAERQHCGDGRGHEPPGVEPGCDECRRDADRESDARGGAPVVADDEVPPEEPEGPDATHANAGRRRRLRVVTAAA